MVEWKKLGEVCDVYDGTHQTPKYTDYGVKFVSVENIHAPYNSTKYISEEDYKKNYKNKPRQGDVLMTRIGDVGTCTVLNCEEPIAYYVSLALLRPNNQLVQSNYVKYILESNIGKRELRKKTLLTAVPLKINLRDVGKVIIPIPSISEQARIVGILDTFTASIDNLKEQIAQRRKQYEHYRDQLFLFEGKDLEKKKIEDVLISLKTGLNPRSNFKLNEEGSSLPYITGKDIFNNSINVSEKTDKITKDALLKINKRAHLESNLLLFASTGTGTVGRMAIIKEYNDDWGISETLYALKTNDTITPQFLMYLLYSNLCKKQFEPKISKGSVPHLKVVDLLRVLIPLLPLSEQFRIVSVLDTFESSISNLEKQLSNREKQYEYYRNKLLTFE